MLGGLGSVAGAYFGGMIVGIMEAFAGYYVDPALKQAIWFLIFLAVLVFRPSGLFGQVGAEEIGFREQIEQRARRGRRLPARAASRRSTGRCCCSPAGSRSPSCRSRCCGATASG